MKSKLFSIDIRDLINGIFVAFLTALLAGIIDILGNGGVFDWSTLKPVVVAGISAALSYLLKCLMSNSSDQLFTREPERGEWVTV